MKFCVKVPNYMYIKFELEYKIITVAADRCLSEKRSERLLWVGIQKPVVTYDSRKSSVTSSARLPNYLKINL
jgi:Fe-S oxidoreductase